MRTIILAAFVLFSSNAYGQYGGCYSAQGGGCYGTPQTFAAPQQCQPQQVFQAPDEVQEVTTTTVRRFAALPTYSSCQPQNFGTSYGVDNCNSPVSMPFNSGYTQPCGGNFGAPFRGGYPTQRGFGAGGYGGNFGAGTGTGGFFSGNVITAKKFKVKFKPRRNTFN